jgi:hypothetical protein
MDKDRRKLLEDRKERLQQLLTLKNYSEQHIEPWLFIYKELIEKKVQPEVHYLASAFDLDPEILRQAVDELLQDDHKFLLNKIITAETLPVHEKLEEYYPSSNPIRYMPESDKTVSDEDSDAMIRMAIAELSIPEQTCFVLYPVYSPVMELPLSDIITNCDIIIEPMTDVCIIAKDYSWIIFHSLEEEWVWRRQS